MNTAEGEAECKRLEQDFELVRDKFINEDSSEKLVEDVLKNHELTIKRVQEDMEALGDAHKALKQQAESNQQVIQDKRDRLNILKQNIEKLKVENQRVMMENEGKQKIFGEQTRRNTKENELVQTRTKVVKSRAEELERAAEYFQDRLALEFKKLSGERMQIIFTNIDPDQQDKKYVITVKITENQYEVTECDPAVEGLDEMVVKLNKTSHFSLFIINLRRKFREMV
ncbi:kinetochore protein Spc25-like [Saccoglossus kowalevskii]|uniref:Kinetochore protein SPC25 n=1 Tax=Saccoglossus kowalevskii TaxID=10224 RepID=A0ABM0H1X8_SACKO|nr:PREDICTED: kinetochore protein Spc25-like [Saccoglossus kowalevskii]